MKQSPQKRNRFTLGRLAVSLLLALAILAAALPQPAQAATTCRTYHFVQEGETTPYIAHTYNLKWGVIAAANDMDPAEKLTVGERLCIPVSDDTKRPVKPAGDNNAVISVTIAGDQVFINLSKFSSKHNYLVKARDVDTGVGGWYRLGTIQVTKNKDFSFTFAVPKDLRDVPILSVCLKDMTTDELICRSAVNP